MLEALIELMVEGGFELILQIACELVLDKAGATVQRKRRKPRPLDRRIALALLILAGLVVGLISAIVLPPPIGGHPIMGALGLALSPLAAGTIMFLYGRWRLKFGIRPGLATFWGGFLFAAGISIARVWAVRLG